MESTMLELELQPLETVEVPYFNGGVCGIPEIFPDTEYNTIAIPCDLVEMGVNFVVKAKGKSMMDCGITDGDNLAIKRQNYAEDGDIVLAIIDGQSTIKAFFQDEKGDSWLLPQNGNFSPIKLKENMNARIWGKVVSIIHENPKISYKDCRRVLDECREFEEGCRELKTPEAMALWKKLQDAGLVDENLNPKDSMKKAAILARVMGDRLNLNPQWPPFEKLWRIKGLANRYSMSLNFNYYTPYKEEIEKALDKTP